jgi:hypothetical protein
MARELKWTSPTNVSSPISGVTVNSGAGSLGTEYDNETNKKRWASFELTTGHGSAPTAYSAYLLYLLYALDGTNYEDGGAATQPAKLHVAAFPMRAVTGTQIVSTGPIPLLPFKVKALVWNNTNQNSSASAVTLDMEVFGEELQ